MKIMSSIPFIRKAFFNWKTVNNIHTPLTLPNTNQRLQARPLCSVSVCIFAQAFGRMFSSMPEFVIGAIVLKRRKNLEFIPIYFLMGKIYNM